MPKRHQVATKLFVDHRAFVDDDQLGARHRALPVQRKGRRYRRLAGRLVGDLLLAARPIDQRMDRAGIDRALRAQHLRRLAGEGGELHLPVDMFGEIARQRRLAGAGIAEQAEDLRPARLQPARHRLQRFILLRGEFHGSGGRIRGCGASAAGHSGADDTGRQIEHKQNMRPEYVAYIPTKFANYLNQYLSMRRPLLIAQLHNCNLRLPAYDRTAEWGKRMADNGTGPKRVGRRHGDKPPECRSSTGHRRLCRDKVRPEWPRRGKC